MEMMDMAADDNREELRRKLRSNFDGRIVRKDLTKKIKEGANVPVYVLEFLLGQYCSSDDETIIEQGVQNVKRILADNFVRPDEAQKILSQLRKNGSLFSPALSYREREQTLKTVTLRLPFCFYYRPFSSSANVGSFRCQRMAASLMTSVTTIPIIAAFSNGT